jgi:hypothetical protein
VLTAACVGAVLGGVWGWLYLTTSGGRVRDHILPTHSFHDVRRYASPPVYRRLNRPIIQPAAMPTAKPMPAAIAIAFRG